jgi:hypothetical protein
VECTGVAGEGRNSTLIVVQETVKFRSGRIGLISMPYTRC